MAKRAAFLVILIALCGALLLSVGGAWLSSGLPTIFLQVAISFACKASQSLMLSPFPDVRPVRMLGLFSGLYVILILMGKLVSLTWPALFGIWLMVQQVILFHGINGFLWRKRPKKFLSLLPIRFYMTLVVVYGVIPFMSKAGLRLYFHALNLDQNLFWARFCIYAVPLMIFGFLLILLLRLTKQTPYIMRGKGRRIS